MPILVESRAGVTTITLNRPEVMNAINPEMQDALQAAFDAFAQDDNQRICLVTGAGDRAFCAGTDLKAAALKGGPTPYPANGYGGLVQRFDLDKPVIAVVNGLALGGGFEIVLACDLVIASETASFGLPEPKVGAVALGGGLHRLARQIGLKRAMGMILSAQRIDAAEAYRLGLVNEVVSPDQLLETAGAWCDAILACAPLAIEASKQTVMRGLGEPTLEAAIRNQTGYPAYARWAGSEDLREGPRAFAERRPPRWRGV